MDTLAVVSPTQWLTARRQLLEAEERMDALRQEVDAQRKAMPAEVVTKDYVFEGPSGPVHLAEVFEGRRQLIVQHFMFDPDWDEGCPVCSLQVDGVGHLAHLHAQDTTFALVSRAPIDKIEAFRRRMGWDIPWYSSAGSDFNMDLGVTIDESVAPVRYNYRSADELRAMGWGYAAQPGEKGGVSVFVRSGDQVLHTYSAYGGTTYPLVVADVLMALTPFGDPAFDLRHHDRYNAG